ncbi:MAG: GNAT family N-acetyltransferase [Verrucomicrobiales bacterium]
MVDEDVNRARDLVAFQISSRTSLAGKIWVARRLRMILEDSAQQLWMYRAIVRKADNEMVGHLSFHHKFPDPDLAQFSNSGVELGYTIEPGYRRMGYARESIMGMIGWARAEQTDADVFVTISPENQPSMQLAGSLGFIKVGENQDELDGLEYVMKWQPKYQKTNH